MRMSLPGRLAGLLLAVGVSVSGALFLAPAASAIPNPAAVSALSFTPAMGLDTTPMYVIVPKPCPRQATNVLAKAVGRGFPDGGQTVISNSTSGISNTGPFILPLQDSFTGFAADNGSSLLGAYVVTVRCINRLGTATYASFTATITFSDAHHFTAPAPAKSLVAALVAAQNPASTTQTQPVQPSVGASGSVPSAAVIAQGKPAASAPASRSPSASKSSSTSSHTWQPVLLGLALLVIALAILMRVVEVRRERARVAGVLLLPEDGSEFNELAAQPSDLSILEPRA
jgi:hypothetical protein